MRFISAGRAGPAAVIACALGMACCSAPFQTASDAFATSAQAGTEKLMPSFATASSLCRTRARLDFLFAREQGPTPELWGKWYKEHLIDGSKGNTWKAQCDALSQSDEMLTKGLEAVGAYSDALKGAAESSQYDGATLKDLVNDSAALGKALAQSSTSVKPVTDTLSGLAGPISSIGKFAAQGYAAAELKKAVHDGGPEIQKILEALAKYNAFLEPSIAEAESTLANVLDQADATLREDDKAASRPKPDAMRLLAFHDVALRYEQELGDVRRTWAAYRGAIAALHEANGALIDAADGKMSEGDALKLVMGFANEVVTQIATLKTVAAGGRD